MMVKRAVGLLLTVILVFGLLSVRLAMLSSPNNKISQAATTHGSYNVVINTTRGTIYDSAHKPLVNNTPAYYALVTPDNIPRQLTGLSPCVMDVKTLETKLSSHFPFAIEVTSPNINVPGVTVISSVKRYADDMAPQLIGYLNSEGSGAVGIEKAFDSVLKNFNKTLMASFPVDASGKKLQGLSAEIKTTGNGDTGGVTLTLDRDIQQAAQTAAEKYLGTGFLLVMEPKTGDILACVSVPSFSPNALAQAIKATNSPMINRAFSSYNLGSVFKIAMVAAALEGGIDPSFSYTCYGNITVSGQKIKCAEIEGHGKEDMAAGFSNSCNPYFINLGQKIGKDKILQMAKSLGFASAVSLCPGYNTSTGSLTTSAKLDAPVALANLSIGQGDLMANSVQVARMVSSVVNGGMIPTPRLIKELVDNRLSVTKSYPATVTDRVYSDSTASLLKQYMIKTINEGTGTAAKPAYGGAGGKTGTAETGIMVGGKAIDQAWFAGFYPADSPKYVIVAMKENGSTGGVDAAPAFRYLANYLAPRCGYPQVADPGEQ